MSDEPIRLPEGIAPPHAGGVRDHRCEHPGCKHWGGFGFGRPKGAAHWFCREHKGEGERFL